MAKKGVKCPGIVAVLCVVPSGLVLYTGITSCTFPPWTEMSNKKNNYEKQENTLFYGLYSDKTWVLAGADEQELATPILSLCHGIFTD